MSSYLSEQLLPGKWITGEEKSCYPNSSLPGNLLVPVHNFLCTCAMLILNMAQNLKRKENIRKKNIYSNCFKMKPARPYSSLNYSKQPYIIYKELYNFFHAIPPRLISMYLVFIFPLSFYVVHIFR